MQAGLASRKLTFRDVFTAPVGPAGFVLVRSRAQEYHGTMEINNRAA